MIVDCDIRLRISLMSPRVLQERRRDWTKTMLSATLQYGVLIARLAPYTWNELPISSGLVDDSGGKEVW